MSLTCSENIFSQINSLIDGMVSNLNQLEVNNGELKRHITGLEITSHEKERLITESERLLRTIQAYSNQMTSQYLDLGGKHQVLEKRDRNFKVSDSVGSGGGAVRSVGNGAGDEVRE
jgi:hypothetical protein